MIFKDEQVEKEFKGLSIFLQQIAKEMDWFCHTLSNKEILITRVLEKIDGDSGVHEDHRAFDVRDEFNGDRLFDESEVKDICNFLNETFKRNDGKPTCISHSFNGGPIHFHVQIAALTRAYEQGVE